MKTLLYVTTQDVDLYRDSLVLPKGSFAKVINRYYLPKAVLEDDKFRWVTDDYEFCYTHFGIVPIKKTYLREDK